MRPILLVLVLAGCFPSSGPGEVDVAIDSFSMLHISATQEFLEIVVGRPDNIDQADPCPIVDANLTAQLGEVPVPLVTRGGKIGTSPGDDVDDNFCGTVALRRYGPPPGGAAVLELSDPTATLTCNVPDLKAERTLTPVPPESGTPQWRSGQTVTMQWSPARDLSKWTEFSVDLVHVVDGTRTGATSLDATANGDLVHFTVPPVAPGSYELFLSPSPHVLCGEHPATADISSIYTDFAARQAVTIVP